MGDGKEVDELLRLLRKPTCPCGSGGGMACDEDCPGDIRDPWMVDALILLLTDYRSRTQEGER